MRGMFIFLFICSEKCPFLYGYFASGTSYCLFLKFHYRLRDFQDVEPLTYPVSQHIEVLRLSAQRTCRLCTPGNIPITHFF